MSDAPASTPSRFARLKPVWWALGLLAVYLTLQLMFRLMHLPAGVGVDVQAQGPRRVYTTSAWMLLPVMAPMAVPLVFGLVLLRRRGTLGRLAGGALVLAAVLLAVTIVPTVWHGGVVLDPDGFTSTYGFWWHPVSKSVRFEVLAAMTVIHQPRSDGRDDQTLECTTLDGETVAMPLGDNLRAALPTLRQYAQRHQVQVVTIRRRGAERPAQQTGPVWIATLLFLLPAVFLVGLLVFVYVANRRNPGNRMARCIEAGDPAGAILIGESVPPERRGFTTRCNLVVAYQRAGREAEARTQFIELEKQGWDSRSCPEEQYRIVIDHLRGVVGLGPGSDQPEEPAPA